MNQPPTYYDALGRWAEVSNGKAAQLVRIVQHDAGNRYKARPVAFDAAGATETVGSALVPVTNLAEPADAGGSVPANTDAVAIDAGGRWVVFLRQAAVGFVAKVMAAQGGAAYTVRPQVATGAGAFADAPGGVDVAAYNLAELSLGPGAAVDDGALVLVTTVLDNGTPPTARHVFDHPAYAKYLD